MLLAKVAFCILLGLPGLCGAFDGDVPSEEEIRRLQREVMSTDLRMTGPTDLQQQSLRRQELFNKTRELNQIIEEERDLVKGLLARKQPGNPGAKPVDPAPTPARAHEERTPDQPNTSTSTAAKLGLREHELASLRQVSILWKSGKREKALETWLKDTWKGDVNKRDVLHPIVEWVAREATEITAESSRLQKDLLRSALE